MAWLIFAKSNLEDENYDNLILNASKIIQLQRHFRAHRTSNNLIIVPIIDKSPR